MVRLTAKSVIENKFWIVIDNGSNIGTVQYNNGNYVFFNNSTKKNTMLSEKDFEKMFKIVNTSSKKSVLEEVYGYQTNADKVFNVRTEENIPVYTKTENSTNYYAAGYYAIFFPTIKWSSAYCPRLKTLKSYPFIGPFKTEEDVNLAIKRKRYEKMDNTSNISTTSN